MRYFLLVFDRDAGSIVELREYDAADRRAALEDRFARERDLQADQNIEIVVLGARSLEDLQRTHSRYFNSAREIVAKG